MTTEQPNIERMRKLLALAERGVGGEKENADRMLGKLLAKHGMTVEDLTGTSAPKPRTFKARTAMESDLLVQILCMVLDTRSIQMGARRNERWVDLTDAQFAEVEVTYSVMRPALARHMGAAFSAFCMANRLYSTKPSDEPRKQRTPEEEAALEAAARLARATAPTARHGQIAAK